MALDAEAVEEVRRLNVVIHEDERTITAASPCPTADHRPEKIAPRYRVTFACAHGVSADVFCAPCTADRREGIWGCVGRVNGEPPAFPDCDGSRVVRVQTFVPCTSIKVVSDER